MGLLATSEQSCVEASEQCQRFAGITPPTYCELGALLATERPHALAICSPHATHAPMLEHAIERGLHVLCEKPFVWGEAFAARSEALVARFAERGLVLFENCQWPHTLPAFARLHPGALDAPPKAFNMLLEPAAGGRDMLADSLPYPLSLLQRLAPAKRPRAEAISITRQPAGLVALRFEYITPDARIAVAIDLQPSDRHPRRFRLDLDGRAAEREVDPSDYSLRWVCGDRDVPLPDPMSALIAEFVGCASAGADPRAAARRDEISARASLLETLSRSWPDDSAG